MAFAVKLGEAFLNPQISADGAKPPRIPHQPAGNGIFFLTNNECKVSSIRDG